MNIAIIGGGLGGLALAQGLTQAGLRVTVYERDRDPGGRAQGYRISLNKMGLDALRALLPERRFARVADLEAKNVGRAFTFADAQMRPLLGFGEGDDAAITVCRPALRALLIEDMPVVWNKRFAGLEERAGRITLRFADGDRAEADFVVACDGAGSDVRALVPNAPQVIDTGIAVVGATVLRTPEWDARLPLNHRGAVQYLGPRGQTLFVSFCERDDRTPMILWALSQRTSLTKTTMPFDLAPGWHPTIVDLIAATPADAHADRLRIRSSRLKVPAAPLWPSGRVTLLGDAAHAMPPQRGMGGNNAFEDARLLASVMHLPDRTAIYEREMYARAKRAVEASEESANLCHLANPLAAGGRNLILKAVQVFSRAR